MLTLSARSLPRAIRIEKNIVLYVFLGSLVIFAQKKNPRARQGPITKVKQVTKSWKKIYFEVCSRFVQKSPLSDLYRYLFSASLGVSVAPFSLSYVLPCIPPFLFFFFSQTRIVLTFSGSILIFLANMGENDDKRSSWVSPVICMNRRAIS